MRPQPAAGPGHPDGRLLCPGVGETLGAYVLPTLPFNTSEEHASFRGTVTLSPATVMLVLEEVVAGLRQQGFTK